MARQREGRIDMGRFRSQIKFKLEEEYSIQIWKKQGEEEKKVCVCCVCV